MSLSLAHRRTRTAPNRLPLIPAPLEGAKTEQEETGRLAEVIAFPAEGANGRAGKTRREAGGSEAGMATAEYAIATLAAVAFAGLLVLILRSGEVRGMLTRLVELALTAV
ncbi:DUF4244 domain-containing protein [Arthrobacter sulfonylureivorans]|uniref:DUF4244 domain-containing protein n=1 Tax=Arthrobacter sulfonylureivorans TaxID=2486855 RepID=UPI0039E654D0